MTPSTEREEGSPSAVTYGARQGTVETIVETTTSEGQPTLPNNDGLTREDTRSESSHANPTERPLTQSSSDKSSPLQSIKESRTPDGTSETAPGVQQQEGSTREVVQHKPIVQEAKLSPNSTTLRAKSTASSSPSPVFSNNGDGKSSDASDEIRPPGGQSARSGVTPPLETFSVSSDPQVPTTVDVPAQPKFHIARPASAPSLSKMMPEGITNDSSIPSSQSSGRSFASHKGKVNQLRRGKWTVEEEAYVARVIQDFNSGYLNAPAGTTLRSYLSEKLQCDPMRITKKFTGDACIGKRVFHPAVRCPSNTAAIDKAQAELDALERRWRRRLEMQQRDSAKKAAASAAAAAAAVSGRVHLLAPPGTQPVQQNIVTRTASWLDRANAILSQIPSPYERQQSGSHDHANAIRSLPPNEIEDQMKEVQRLIHEGPIIQQSTAGLPHLLDQTGHPTSQSASAEQFDSEQPADKRPRKAGNELSPAEDAEALVGFLNSVRAAAAAGTASGP